MSQEKKEPNPGPGKEDPGAQEPQLSPEEQMLKEAEELQKFKAANLQDIPDPGQIEENDRIAREYVRSINFYTKRLEAARRNLPEPAETREPKPAEPTKAQIVEQAQLQKNIGSTIPISNIRPQAPAQIKEEGSVIVAKGLAEQLGTAPEMKAEMRIDERKMAVLDDATLAALSHFSYRFVYDGVRYWGHITEWWLTGSQGIGGLARRHILQALANTSGVQSIEKAEKPNVLARNIWDRNWREKAESQGKQAEQ